MLDELKKQLKEKEKEYQFYLENGRGYEYIKCKRDIENIKRLIEIYESM